MGLRISKDTIYESGSFKKVSATDAKTELPPTTEAKKPKTTGENAVLAAGVADDGSAEASKTPKNGKISPSDAKTPQSGTLVRRKKKVASKSEI